MAELTLARLLKRVRFNPASGCWDWIGKKHTKGYGIAMTGTPKRGGQKCHRVHKVVYEILRGPVPTPLVLDHLCRNKACCNPAHLEAVTQRENALRGAGPTALNAAKNECIHGHPLDVERFDKFTGRTRRRCSTCDRERQRVRQIETEIGVSP